MVGKRHYEVAKFLKDIPKGTTFIIRLVEPLKSGFASIGPKTSSARAGRKQHYGSGKETLRFKANGQATIEDEVSYAVYVGFSAQHRTQEVDVFLRRICTFLPTFIGTFGCFKVFLSFWIQ